jgi:ataxin-3
VLSEALKTFALECVPLACDAASDARKAPEAECAFLCNLREHWFTIRSVHVGKWYNFNSLYPAPEALSPFYLGAYLSSLQAEGTWVRLMIHLA